MTYIKTDGESLPVRSQLSVALANAWRQLSEPGTWWNGQERLEIAAEARFARGCKFCKIKGDALLSSNLTGTHDNIGRLSADALEAVHQLQNDAGRITERWVRKITSNELTEEAYVELISVVAILNAIDTFDMAIGANLRPFLKAAPGNPTRLRPKHAKRNLAWVHTLAPEDVSTEDPNPYPTHGDKNIHRALSLVPAEVFHFFDLDVELYLKDHEIRDFGCEYRAITHSQIELIAARASAMNSCYY